MTWKPTPPPDGVQEPDQVPINEWEGDVWAYAPPGDVAERDEIPIEQWDGDVKPFTPPDGISRIEELPIDEWSGPRLSCHSRAECPAADVTCDNYVNGFDVLAVCSPMNFGRLVDDAACPRADVDCNGIINGLDVAMVASSACMYPLASPFTDLRALSAPGDPDIDDGCLTDAPCPEADVNCDGRVDQLDLKLMCHPKTFGRPAAEAAYPRADCDGDGYVTGLDIAMVSSSYCLRGPCDSTAACPGADLDCDNLVTGIDIALMTSSANFGLPVTEAAWPESDLDGDGVITDDDVAIAGDKCFGY